MKKRIFSLFLVISLILTMSVSVFAYQDIPNDDFVTDEISIPIPLDMTIEEIEEYVANSFTIESNSDYEIVFLSEEELEEYIDEYTSSKKRNTLSNLVAMTLTTNYLGNAITLKVTNIAYDSLDVAYGYITLYDNYGYCGSASFRFNNIPPMMSDYVTCRTFTGGTFNSGFFFLEAMDGAVFGSTMYYF